MWSSLYDSVSESHEAPSQEIIDDDDALDGWLTIKRREEQTSQPTKSKKSYEEVFIKAETLEDAKKIQAMNGLHGKKVTHGRFSQIQNEESVNLKDFQDIKTFTRNFFICVSKFL